MLMPTQAGELERVLGEYGMRREDVVELPAHQFIMPGLIDTPLGVDSAAAAMGVDRADRAARRAASA